MNFYHNQEQHVVRYLQDFWHFREPLGIGIEIKTFEKKSHTKNSQPFALDICKLPSTVNPAGLSILSPRFSLLTTETFGASKKN